MEPSKIYSKEAATDGAKRSLELSEMPILFFFLEARLSLGSRPILAVIGAAINLSRGCSQTMKKAAFSMGLFAIAASTCTLD
jgi:hypothetical protein